MKPGRIVLLNGPPRSGKSSIARALQERGEGKWVNLGIDLIMQATPEPLRPGIGLRPGGERPELEPAVLPAYRLLYETIRTTALEGYDVVADVCHHESYSQAIQTREEGFRILKGLPFWYVGVRCSIEENISRRSNPDQPGYSTDPVIVQRWEDAVHQGQSYRLELDTTLATPHQCAEILLHVMANG